MEKQTALAETIDIVAEKAKYDQCAKKLLSFKAIDAWILKACVREFSLYSVDYISEHCLIGPVELSEHAVHQDQLNKNQRMSGNEQITKMNVESGSINEGTVYYDIRFNAISPGAKEPVTLMINLEIQTDDKPGYDLAEVIVLNLGEPADESDCGILNLLSTLFSTTVLPAEKKRILNENYNITMTEELESEVQYMCNLSTAIENKGRAEGRTEGRVEGFGLLSKLIDMLMGESRYDDVKKVAKDAAYRDQLLKEFHLIG